MEQSKLLSPSAVADLKREELLPVLEQAEEVYQQMCDDTAELSSVNSRLTETRNAYDAILNQVSAKTRRLWTIIGWVVGIFSWGFLLIPWYFLRKGAYEKDRERNRTVNEQEAQSYYQANIAPLMETRDAIQTRLRALEPSVAWAKDIVTPEIFEMGAVQELLRLVENRRADTLKEALNLFDSNQYRARMESMQEDMLANSDVAAAEAAKQTLLLKQTEKSARETAAASKRTAVNTRRIYTEQRRQNKK